jgi:Protein of unknown function (DUF3153)
MRHLFFSWLAALERRSAWFFQCCCGPICRVGFTIALAALLTGCIGSDVAIRFDSPHQGQIIQHLQLGERLQNLSGGAGQQWLKALEREAKAVGGTLQRSPDQSITIKIPFANSADLEKKFNRFSNAILNPEPALETMTLPMISSQLTVEHRNFIFLERNHLQYEVDLRSLGVLSSQGDVLVSPAALMQLQLRLIAPWGAHSANAPNTLRPVRSGRELDWLLIPGKQNLLDTTFWLPSPLGIGSLVILLLVLLGRYFKYSSSVD